jgi:glycosyltransferase involved in cell wall biosynthesis
MASDRRGFAAHVVRLLEDPDLRERLAAAGRAYVERHHAWSEMGRRLEAIYREVLEESSR